MVLETKTAGVQMGRGKQGGKVRLVMWQAAMGDCGCGTGNKCGGCEHPHPSTRGGKARLATETNMVGVNTRNVRGHWRQSDSRRVEQFKDC